MRYDLEEPDSVEEPVQIDAYGLRTSIRPGPGDAPPPSWTQVWQRIKQDLRRLAVLPTSLVAEAGEGAVRLIRGLTGFPASINARLRAAHDLADDREARRESGTGGPTRHETVDLDERRAELLDRLEAVLEVARSKGRDAAVVQLPDDNVLVVLGTHPNVRVEIEAAASEALKQLGPGSEEARRR